ncbi:MAG: glycoside hydrolase family 57, partial [Candidatus Competibacteraceae bacterium]|nr:glycoside hydrolase family 57 [Candidatus Competibacteraceae bacterium]
RDTSRRIHEVSREFHRIADSAATLPEPPTGELTRLIDQAHWHLLRAETSCNIYWGEAWVYKAHQDLDAVDWHLGEAKALLGEHLVTTSPTSP